METIKLRIRDEEELYSPYDPTLINDDIISFVEQRIKKTNVAFSIRLLCDGPVDEARIRTALSDYVLDRRETLRIIRHQNLGQQIRLLIIGVVFILLWLYVNAKTDDVGTEILSIIGSFAIWEFTDFWLVENPENRRQRLFLRKLESADLVIEAPKAD